MALTLHNSFSGRKEIFTPADPGRVTLYVCGPTVYNHAHIGNFRPVVVFDLLFRLLREAYGDEAVIFARNFTDIDDNIIRASAKSGDPVAMITQKYAKIYQQESAALNALPPTIEPLATAHIGEMIALIEKLLQKQAAYIAEGHVLFDTDRYADYGALSNLKMDEMIAGARVEVAPYKRNPADFVLWKPSSPTQPGWETPAKWGFESKGRPGWHLECSAMIEKNLGTTIDIHGGGQDLRFPHHENEIAQSVCAHGVPLARIWLHNGFLQMGKDKMSKSVGNVALVRDLLRQAPGEVLRWALLSAHYRQPLEWGDGLLEQSKRQLDRFYRLFAEHNINTTDSAPDAGVMAALHDDMNTPAAMAVLHALRERAASQTGNAKIESLSTLRASGLLMGFFSSDGMKWLQQKTGDGSNSLDDGQIAQLIKQRAQAKASGDYARADTIRTQLSADDIIIEDGPEGTTWRRK